MEEAASTSNALRRARTAFVSGVHQTLFEQSRDVTSVLPLLLLLWAFDLVQMLALTLAPGAALPWAAQPIMAEGVFKVTLNVGIVPPGSALPADAELAAVCALLLTTLALFAWSVAAHAGAVAYKPVWRARLLRLLTYVTLQGFIVPVYATLGAVYSCVGTWQPSSAAAALPCWQGAHAAAVFAACTLLPLASVYLFAAALVVVDRRSSKKNCTGAPHGRVFAALFAIKAALALFAGVTAGAVNPWLYTFVIAAGSSAWLWLFASYLPYHLQWLNAVQGAAAAAVLSACACGFLSLGVANPSASVGAIAWLMLLPTSLYSGASLMAARWRSFGATAELASPYAVEIRARFLLADSAQPAPAAGRLMARSPTDAHDGVAAHDDGESKGGAAAGTRAVVTAGDKVAAADAAARAANVRKTKSNATVSEAATAVDALYANALAVFPASALLDLFTAHHQAVTKDNAHLARVYLRSAAAKADASALDVRFFILSAALEAAEEVLATDAQRSGGVGAAPKMTVQRRMHFEELLAETHASVALSRTRILTFWSELCERHPDLARVAAAGEAINESLKGTRAQFEALLELSPNSASVMREYAGWLLEQANDPLRGEELLTDAEQIEDEQSRAHALGMDADVVFFESLLDFDLSAENLAWIRVSALDGSTGLVTGSNTACLKMLGMQRRELIGKDVNTIVPDPIGPVHGLMLARFKADGVEHVVNHSRVAFALHRLGHILPIRINTRPQEEDWVAVLEEINTALSFVWAVGGPQGWRVTAACVRGLSALGTTPSAVKAGQVTLHALFDNPAETLAELLDAPADGAVVSIGGVSSLARLQLAGLSFLPSALYVLRWRTSSQGRSGGGAAEVLGAEGGDDGAASSGSLSPCGSGESSGDGVLAALMPPTQHPLELVPGELTSPRGGCPMATVAAPRHHGNRSVPQLALKKVRAAPAPSTSKGLSAATGLGRTPDPSRDREKTLTSTSPRPSFVFRAGVAAAAIADGDVGDSSRVRFDRVDTVDEVAASYDELSPDFEGDGGGAQRVNSSASYGKSDGKAPGKGRTSSVHSKGSKSSGGASRASSAISQSIRRSVTLRASILDGSLVTLRYTLVFLASLVILMSVAQLIVVMQLFRQLDANFLLVAENTAAAVALQGAYSATQRLTLIASGAIASPDGGQHSFTQLRDSLDKLEDAHLKLYSALDGLSPAQTLLWTVPSIVVGDLQPGSYVSRGNYSVIHRDVSLANGGVEFIGAGRQVAATPLSEIVMSDPDVFFVVQMGWSTLRDAYNASMLIAGDRSASQGDAILIANTVVLGVTLGLLAFIAAFLIAPAVNTVVASKNRVYHVFLAVPLPITRSLMNSVRTKVEALARAAAEAEVGLDVAGAGEVPIVTEDGAGGALSGSKAPGDTSDALDDAIAAAVAGSDEAAGLGSSDGVQGGCCSRSRSGAGRNRRGSIGTSSSVAPGKSPRKSSAPPARRFRSATRVQCALLFQLLWPLAAFAGYYVATFMWLTMTVAVVNQAKEEVLWSSQVRLGATVMSYNARNYLSLRGIDTGELRFIDEALAKCDTRMAIIESAQDDLLYGSTTRNTRAGLQISPTVYDLFLNNGCLENSNYYYTMQACTTDFAAGLVGRGLLGASKTYFQLIHASIVVRRADLAAAAAAVAQGGGGVSLLPIVDLNVGAPAAIEKLGEDFLVVGYAAFETSTVAAARAVMNSFISALLLACLACIAALGVFALAIYVPTIARLDRDIKMVRVLLLLFPDKVSTKVPAILAVARELQGDGRSGGSAIT